MSYVVLGAAPKRSGLGEYTKTYPDGKAVTVGYYSNPNMLVFSDRNLENFYKSLRDADIDFQKMLLDVATFISPLLDAIQIASAGNIKKSDVVTALNNIKSPGAGLAVVLEVIAGRRPFDAGVKSFLLQFAKDLKLVAASLGIVAGVSGTLTLAGYLIPGAQAAVPFVQPVAQMATPVAILAGVVVPILEQFGKEEVPTKQKFKEMMGLAAVTAGKAPPSDETVDKAYREMLAVRDAAKAEERAAKAASSISKDYPVGTLIRLKGAPETVYRVMGVPDKDQKVPVLYLYGPKEGSEKRNELSVWLGNPKTTLFTVKYTVPSGPNKGNVVDLVSPVEDIYKLPGQRVFLEGNPEEVFTTVSRTPGQKTATIRNTRTRETITVSVDKLRPAKDSTPEWAAHREKVRLERAAEDAKREAAKAAANAAAKADAQAKAAQARQEAASAGMDLTAFLKARAAEEEKALARGAGPASSVQSIQQAQTAGAVTGTSSTLLYALGGAALLGVVLLSRRKK